MQSIFSVASYFVAFLSLDSCGLEPKRLLL